MTAIFLKLLHWFVTNIFGGIILILFGKSTISWIKKNPQLANQAIRPDFSAWIAAIGFIVLGAIVIIRNLISYFMNF